MKIIEGKEKEYILEEGEKMIISSMQGNKIKLRISCKNGAVHIDDIPAEKIKNLKEENEAIKAMRKYKKTKS